MKRKERIFLAAFCALLHLWSTTVPARAEDLLPPPKPVEQSSVVEQDLIKRRSYLRWHQGLGIAGATLLAGTAVVGQLHYNDVIKGSASGKYQLAHRSMAITSAALLATTAILGYVAPAPYEKKSGVDTVTLHKWTMAIVLLAMAAQIGLGVAAKNSRGSQDEADLAKIHLGLGYGTLGLTALGIGVHFF